MRTRALQRIGLTDAEMSALASIGVVDTDDVWRSLASEGVAGLANRADLPSNRLSAVVGELAAVECELGDDRHFRGHGFDLVITASVMACILAAGSYAVDIRGTKLSAFAVHPRLIATRSLPEGGKLTSENTAIGWTRGAGDCLADVPSTEVFVRRPIRKGRPICAADIRLPAD